MNIKFLPAIAAALMIGAAPMAMANQAPGTSPQDGEDTRVEETDRTPGPMADEGDVAEDEAIATEDDPDALVDDPDDVDPDDPVAEPGDVDEDRAVGTEDDPAERETQ